ncbi:MAG: DUF4436 family protein [Pyrinomonadaceae bacterium]
MSDSDRFSIKEAVAVVVILAIIGGAIYFTLGQIASEGVDKTIEISNLGDAEADHVQAIVKVTAIDPIKGDFTARIDLEPSGTLVNADGTLKQDLRVFIDSANGKRETDFAKGKRLAPVEGVFNLYGGNATDYPFDKYEADTQIYIVKSKPAEKKKIEPAPAAEPNADGEKPADAVKKEADEEEDSNEIALSVDFEASISGYTFTAAKSKDTDEGWVNIESRVERSGIVKLFSIFVSTLMWILSIGVLFLMMSVILRGRKVELAMFSFMATLLFAFYAVRNSQPNVPPIGVFMDFASFFWVEMIVATCLVVGLVTWLFRASK